MMDISSMAAFAPLVVAALGWTWYVFSKIKQVDDSAKRLGVTEAKLDAINDNLTKINVHLERLGVALWGIDGMNDLRGELKEVSELVHDHLMKRRKTDHHNHE